MPLVAVGSLVKGMILAEAAIVSGREILPAGALVDGPAIARLEKAGVAWVNAAAESRGPAEADAGTPGERGGDPGSPDAMRVHANLMRVAVMFGGYREDPLMRELCRLAVKCAQERLIGV